MKPISKMRSEHATLVDYLLGEIEAKYAVNGRTHHFIEGLRLQFNLRGWLSEKQLDALRKFYAKAT